MSNSHKIHWSANDVLCPFFMREDKAARLITCESYVEKGSLTSRFKSLAQKDNHMSRHCASKFEQCPVYKAVYHAKYSS